MSEYSTREDRQPYETPVVANSTCGYCGAVISQRAEGRYRLYCDSTCRSGAYRRSRPRQRTKLGLKRTSRS